MTQTPRISVIIPTLNAASELPGCLDALLSGVEAGLIRELIVSDGGSDDGTGHLAEDVGAIVVSGPPGRGGQLRRGAHAAQAEWLLFLHADTRLSANWAAAVAHHIQTDEKAAAFRLKFRANGLGAAWTAAWANLRTKLFHLPYGDQGLLISRTLYDEVGGYSDIPLMEDVAIAFALRGKLKCLPETASTGAEKYLEQGWVKRGTRNLWTLIQFLAGKDPAVLARTYQKS